MNRYNVIGIMSGTSLDGLDICYASFIENTHWKFEINYASTIELPIELKKTLQKAISLDGLNLSLLNNSMGDFIGDSVNHFISLNKIEKKEVDFISSHGHTIFHQPKKQLSLQIGNGANISSKTALPVVCDFRTSDIALNGNGAPLVPIGDQFLFSQYDSCVNLGGISNISYNKNSIRIAYDICPVNMVLNYLANKLSIEYDKDGKISESGKINAELLNQLNKLSYFNENPPKSLGYEWVNENVFPLLENKRITTPDLLRTFTEHIAHQISINIPKGKSLFTGGGTHNTFLMERIKGLSNSEIIIPNKEIIDFKEALIFAFLGVLRWKNKVNTLKSVTGSNFDNIGGCIYNSLSL